MKNADGFRVKLVFETVVLEGVVEVLDHEVLRVRCAEAPEVDEKRIPGVFLHITMLQGLEG